MSLDPITIENLDEDSDSPRLARIQLRRLVEGFNTLVSDTRIEFSVDSLVIPVDDLGVPTYDEASVQITVKRFNQNETPAWILGRTGVDVTSTLIGNTLSVTGLSKDTGYVTISATREGYATISRRLLVTRSRTASGLGAPDSTRPPTPSNLQAVGGISNILLSWDISNYEMGRGPGRVNIYGKTILDSDVVFPDFSSPGVQLVDTAEGYTSLHTFSTDPSTRWALWIKFQTRDGFESLLPSNRVIARTTENPAKLLQALNQLIDESLLANVLRNRIDLIDGPSSLSGSVSQRVLNETNNRIAAIQLETNNRITAINSEVGARIAAINALNAVKNRTFYSDSAPISEVGVYTLQVNDTWINTSSGANTRFRWNGSTWVSADDARTVSSAVSISNESQARLEGDLAQARARESLHAALFAGAGTDYKLFNQESEPSGTQIGDIWTWKTAAGVETFKRFNGSSWIDSLSNKRAASLRGEFSASTLPLTGNVIGDLARRTDDNLIVVWNGSSWELKTSPQSLSQAFVEQERVARATGDSVEASQRNTLAVQLRGVYTGTDVASLSSGLIFSERQARATADLVEVAARESLYAGLGGSVGTDYRIFNQEATPVGTQIGDLWTWKTLTTETFSRWNGASWVDSRPTRRAAVYRGVFASLPTVDNVIGDLARLQPPENTIHVWNGSVWVIKTELLTPSWAFVEQERQARTTADTSEASARLSLATQLRGSYLGTDISQVSSGLFLSERQARTAADESEVSARESLAAGVQGTSGSEYRLFNQANQPVATQIGDVWTWKTPTVETFSRWNGSVWTDSVSNKRFAFFQGTFENANSLPISGLVIGDTAVRTNPSPASSVVWNGSSWVLKIVNISTTHASVEQEKIARASAVSAEAAERNTLATQLRGNYTGTSSSLVTSGLIFEERQARLTDQTSIVSRISVLEAGTQSVSNQFTETWSQPDPLGRWEILPLGASDVSVSQSSNGQSGWVLTAGNNSGNDQIALIYRDAIPFLTDQLYKITVKLRKTAGTGVFIGGYVGVASDGITYVNASGANELGNQHYGSLVNINPGASESTFTAYYKRGNSYGGSGTRADPTTSHPEVRYIRPLLIFNYPGLAGIMQCTLLSLEIVDSDISALESSVSTLTTQLNNPVSGLSATANRVNTLESSVYNPNASNNPTYAFVVNNYSTTAQVNSAIAAQVSTVNARLNNGGDIFNSLVQVNSTASAKSANFVQPTAPTSGGSYTLRVGDTWINTSNGRIQYAWDGAAWQVNDDVRIGQTASQLTTVQSRLEASGNYDAIRTWNFDNSSEGWFALNSSIQNYSTYLRLISNSSDPVIGISVAPVVSGAQYDKIRARVRRVAGTSWQGTLYYGTSNHGDSNEFRKTIPDNTVLNDWVVLEWDMSLLTEGGQDWVNSNISSIRLDLGNSSSDIFDIDWVAIGRRGVPAGSAVLQQEISTRASESAYFGLQYSVKGQITSGGRTVVGGFGLTGTSSGSAGPTFDFGVNANTFWIGAPSGASGVADVRPFIVRTTDSVDPSTGVLIPKGVYMDSLYLTNLTALWGNFGTLVANSIRATDLSADRITTGTMSAARIDTRGMIVRDNAGNPIIGLGIPLPIAYAAPGTVNSDLAPAINNAAQTANWSNVASRPSNLANLTGSEGINNASISLSPTGQLQNAGGGQVETTPVLDRDREIDRAPSWYPTGVTREFKHAAAIGLNDSNGYWVTLETIKQFADSSGGFPGYQYAYQIDKTWRRRAADDSGTNWAAWAQDLDRNAYTGDLNATLGAPVGTPVSGNFPGGNSAATVETNLSTALNNASAALAGLNTKLNKSAADSLNAPITLETSGAIRAVNGTNSLVMSPTGIVGLLSGVPRFVLNINAGSLTFAGDISGSTGTFVGTLRTNSAQRVGTSMTGSGALFEPDGSGCWGNTTTNITHTGSQLVFNGPIVGTPNLQHQSVSSIYVAEGYSPSISGISVGEGERVLITVTNSLWVQRASVDPSIQIQRSGSVIRNFTLGRVKQTLEGETNLVDTTILPTAVTHSDAPSPGVYTYSTLVIDSQPETTVSGSNYMILTCQVFKR
jgi:Domain of unknown function (DUF1983)